MKNSKLRIVQWIFSVMFIFDGLVMTIGTNILFIFMLIFGLSINPKFNDIYVKLMKKDPIKKTPRIIASVISFLMIYIAMGVYGSTKDDDNVSTVDSKEVFTEITTVSTSVTTQTEATTIKPVETSTEEVTTTETTQEVVTELSVEETLYPIVEDETPYREIYDYFMNLLDDESNPENEEPPRDSEELQEWMKTFSERHQQYEDDCQNSTAEKYGITYDDVENIWLYFVGGGKGYIDLGAIKPNNLNDKNNINISQKEVTTTVLQNEFTLNTGELLDVTKNGDILVIKVKIQGSYNNEATIKQNYHNLENIIKQGGYNYNEIQYWAVADMNDGSESKVVSFTVNKSVIDSVNNGNLIAIQLGDYVNDLWIHPSLKD